MEMKVSSFTEKEATVSVIGRVSSTNADQFSSFMDTVLSDHTGKDLFLDAKELELITSAGLRVILRVLKKGVRFRIINVNDKLYELFEMTGFTELMPIDRPVRKLLLGEDAVVLGHGANSTVYKLEDDLVVKVLRKGYDQAAIKKELEKTRRAFVMGIPTVIPYAVVEVDGRPGVAFELVETKSLVQLIAEDRNNLDKYLDSYVDSVKQFHSIEVEGEDREIFTDAAVQIKNFRMDLEGHADPAVLEKLDGIIRDFSVGSTALHGDIQPSNVMVTDEVMLYIDMDNLSYGNPEFDLVYLYSCLIGFTYVRPNADFFGIDNELSAELWDKFLRRYFRDKDEAFIRSRERIYKALSLCRVYRWALRHIGDKPETAAVLKTAFEDAVREC